MLDMGEPVKIDTMARNMIRLSGFEPDVDIKVVYTGLRPGEKLYEELLTRNADLRRTENEKIFVEEKPPVDPAVMEQWLSRRREVAGRGGREEIFRELHLRVPTFRDPDEVNAAAIQAVEQGEAVRLTDFALVQQV